MYIYLVCRFVAVMDGHGGKQVALYAKQRTEQYFYELLAKRMKVLPAQLRSTMTQLPSNDNVMDAFKITTRALDAEVGQKKVLNHQGCTFCGVYINRLTPNIISEQPLALAAAAAVAAAPAVGSAGAVEETKNTEPIFSDYSIISCNIGDSRAVLSRRGAALDLTVDHKPDDPSEKARIEKLGGFVKWHGDW